MKAKRILPLLTTVVFAACQPMPQHCVPGETSQCACPDGTNSAQICSSNGEFGACSCSNPNDNNFNNNNGGACSCDVTYACDAECAACDPECTEGSEPAKDPTQTKDECAFGGTYEYFFDMGRFPSTDCHASDIVQLVTNAARGTLDLSYDAVADVVHLTGPFGAELETVDLALGLAETDEGPFYGVEQVSHGPNIYGARYDAMEYVFQISISKRVVQTPECDSSFEVAARIGFGGGPTCVGPIIVYFGRDRA